MTTTKTTNEKGDAMKTAQDLRDAGYINATAEDFNGETRSGWWQEGERAGEPSDLFAGKTVADAIRNIEGN